METQDITTTELSAPTETTEVQPTQNVKNFWERLDDVFIQNNELRKMMQDLVENFPEFEKARGPDSSFIFQPDRISLCSNDDIQPSTALTIANPNYPTSTTVGHTPSEKFSAFRIRLSRPLRNVKSIQLLSAVIPNAIQNIPDDQVFFFWYRLRQVGDGVTVNASTANKGAWPTVGGNNAGDIVSYLGNTYAAIRPSVGIPPTGNVNSELFWTPCTLPADTTRPNYYDISQYTIQYLLFTPTYSWPADFLQAGNQLLYNRTFTDYADLVLNLNYIMLQPNNNNSSQNDISFQYDDVLNKIVMIPNPANIAAGYYYLPCGYEDPNITKFMTNPNSGIRFNNTSLQATAFEFNPGYTLNLRLGFTWNGVYIDPYTLTDPWNNITLQQSLYWYLRKKDPGFFAQNIPNPNPPPPFLPSIPDWSQSTITFNNYPDLVNTSCVRIYCDFVFGSTQDSLGSNTPQGSPTIQGLLSIIPVNTTNLGVGYYQNNFNNPLKKIPQNITEIGISMFNDQGKPYYLPNSATVILELAIEYN